MTMPPPKIKLYKSGKLKTINKPQQTETFHNGSSASNRASHTSNQFDSESDRQFELELAWCIQSMESSLNGGKLNANQGLC